MAEAHQPHQPHQPPNHPQQPPNVEPPPAPQPPQQHPDTDQPSSPPSLTSQDPSDSPVQQQARVAAVLYDLMLRGGQDAATMIPQLSAAFPSAARIAQDYATYARALTATPTPSPIHTPYPAQLTAHRGDFVLRRVNAQSVAWFCFFSGALVATIRLFVIFSLALGATLAHAADNTVAFHVFEYIAAQSLGDGPVRELYRWLFALLTEQNPLVVFGDAPGLPDAEWVPSYVTAALMLTPLSVGVVCFILGGLAAVSVNFALRAAGGIRFEHRED